jgi:hypothetical protein
MRGTVVKRHRRRSASQKMLQQRSEEGLDTKSGSVEVGPIQPRGVRDLDLNSSSVAVEPLQPRGAMYGVLRGAWRGQALPRGGLHQGGC